MSRKRGKNFTEEEKKIAKNIIDKYSSVVENKATDGISQAQKQKIWEKISKEFNTKSSQTRTAQQLKIFYSNYKAALKKTIAEDKKQRYLSEKEKEKIEQLKHQNNKDKQNVLKTGGGAYTSQLTDEDARILATVEPSTQPLVNVYDDDNSYHGDVTLSPSRGACISSPIPDLNVNEPQPEQEEIEPSQSPIITENPKRYVPPLLKRQTNKNLVQLKRDLLLKKLEIADMEINFKGQFYEMELKLKRRELEGSC